MDFMNNLIKNKVDEHCKIHLKDVSVVYLKSLSILMK